MLHRNRRYLIYSLTILILSFSLACSLGIFGDRDGSDTPAVDLDGGIGSSPNDDGDAAAIDESASAAPDEEDAEFPEETQKETSQAEASSAAGNETGEEPTTSAELDEDQIFVLPGSLPPTLDPHLSGDATSAEYVVEIFSGLMAYDRELNLIPDIAESYEISEDGLVYTFKIRPEAQFQDGKPIRAEDFRWSFERACDPATGSPTADTYLGDIVGCRKKLQGQADSIEGLAVIDDLTLQLTIDEPKGFFLAKMTYPTAYVLDRENVEAGGDTWFIAPNGSGPFKLDEVSPMAIVLAKNENYYGDKKPVLERVIYLINAPLVPLTGYEEGISSLEGIDSLGLPPDTSYYAVPIGRADLSRVTDPNNSLSKEFTSVNALSIFYIGFNVNKPPFDDVKVRQAFNLALNKNRMVKVVFQGTVPPANGIVPPNMPGYQNPDLSDYEFDPERALQLIAESSYGDVADLPEITLNVSGAGTRQLGPVVESILESYETNLGIQINVEQVAWPDFLADLNNPDMPYQMYQLGWIADYPDPQNFLEILFHSESTQNHGGYNNPALDDLLDRARGVQDPDERLALYQQAEQMILDDAAWIPIYFDVANWLVKPYVQNFEIPPIKIPKFQYVSIAEH